MPCRTIRAVQARARQERRPGPRRSVGGVCLCLLIVLAGNTWPADEVTVEAPPLAEFEQLAAQGRHEELVARLEPIVEAWPERAEPRFLLGNAYAGLGRYEEAIDVYVALTRDFPGRPEPHNNLAVIFVEQDRLEEARTALLAAARLRPGYARAQENLGDLYGLMAERAYARANALRRQGPSGAEQAPDAAAAAEPDRRQPSPITALAQRRAVIDAVEAWRRARNDGDLEAYVASYLPDYRPDAATSHDAWRRKAAARLAANERGEVDIETLERLEESADRAIVTFDEHRHGAEGGTVNGKRLVLERRGARWLIAEEHLRADGAP